MEDLTTTCQTGMTDETICGRKATHIRRNSMDEQRGSCAYHASSNYGRKAKRIPEFDLDHGERIPKAARWDKNAIG